MAHETLGGSDWQKVFVDRSVWRLTPEYIDIWRTQNKNFFSFVSRYVPAGGKITELGCGPGRHAISMALMGYRVVAVDLDRKVLDQARINAEGLAPNRSIQLCRGNIFELDSIAEMRHSDAITHGGLMEHFPSKAAIRASLSRQLEDAPYVIFDVPLGTAKNTHLFEADDVFRQEWSSERWREEILAGFNLVAWKDEIHEHPSMTDDLVCVLKR